MFIQYNGDHHARFKASAGTSDAHATFLTQGIKRAVELMDLPAAKRHLADPGEGGDGDECGDHIDSFNCRVAAAPYPAYGLKVFVGPVSVSATGQNRSIRTSPARR